MLTLLAAATSAIEDTRLARLLIFRLAQAISAARTAVTRTVPAKFIGVTGVVATPWLIHTGSLLAKVVLLTCAAAATAAVVPAVFTHAGRELAATIDAGFSAY